MHSSDAARPLLDPTLDPVRAAQAEWIEQAALLDIHAATPRALRADLGPFHERGQGTLLLGAPGLPSVIMNRLFVSDDASPASVRDAAERMRARGASRYFAHLDARAPSALRQALLDAGLGRFHRSWVKLAIARERVGRESAVPGAGEALRAARRQDAEAFAELQVRCQGLDARLQPVLAALVDRPRWHVFFAWQGDKPVATGALFVQGELGYLAFGATLPEARGRGLQRALLQKRLRVAVALGCSAIGSETGVEVAGEKNSSCNNMQALGMQVVATRDNFVPSGTEWR